MRGGCDEAEFLLRGARVGPYLTCRRGRDFERANRDWCRDVVEVLRARREVRAES
ncbi:PadR family transcriptional regulator, partial [Streptomyces anulatus]